MPTVTIKRHPHQRKAMESEAPYMALVTGVGGGKTWTGARWLLRRACQNPRSVHLATANSFPQLRDVVVPELLRACNEIGIGYEYQKNTNTILLDVCRGAPTEIRVRSTERYDLLRGAEYGSWWGDEVRDASREALEVVFGRLRCTKVTDRPKYLWTTTPNGYDYVWQRHVENQDPRYMLVRATTRDNPSLPTDYVDQLMSSYDEKLAAQEVGGEFVVLDGAHAYRSFARTDHCKPLEYSRSLDLHLCFDFNVSPMAAIICQEIGDEIHALDECIMSDVGIYDLCAELRRRYAGHAAGIVVHGDAAGNQRTAQTGRTSYAMVREGLAGLGRSMEMNIQTSNPSQRERVDTVNVLLRNAYGQIRLFVDPRCRELVRDFEQVAFDQSGSLDKSDLKRTHASDAIGYYLHRRHRPSGFRSEAGRGIEPRIYSAQAPSRSGNKSSLRDKYGNG